MGVPKYRVPAPRGLAVRVESHWPTFVRHSLIQFRPSSHLRKDVSPQFSRLIRNPLSRDISTKHFWHRLPVLLLAAFSVACVGNTLPPKRLAILRVEAVPEQAQVIVDGRPVGRATVLAQVGKALKPGVHFVTFKARGYFPHDVRLDLAPGDTVVKMKLRPIPE